MQTRFTIAQLANPDIEIANGILRACVHCGFCTATCPTYALLGDELDGPRGRIYLIKEMLEAGGAAPEPVVTHVDRCLSCLSCMTTCPSSVHYMHLVDIARKRIQETHVRPLIDRVLRRALVEILPHRGRFRIVLRVASRFRGLASIAPRAVRPLFALAPRRIPTAASRDIGVFAADGERKRRVALLAGCVQPTLAPQINAATIRLLTRLGCEIVVPKAAGCCGALTHHLGREVDALASAKANLAAWRREIDSGGLDAVVVNASGCGTMVKDYGFLLRNDPEWAETAAQISALACDISELVDDIGLPNPRHGVGGVVAYQSACSLRHGQKIVDTPARLLREAGFEVREPIEAHLCCGSAGTYNILQPEIANRLRDRKVDRLEALSPDVIASGNIGCMTQIGGGSALPVVHMVELLDWATGGPKPEAWQTAGR
jgi:glycolate oxidase iron-sulfur subunit